MIFLEQSQTATVLLGPFVDETNGKDAETALTLSQADIHLSKNGAALAQKNDASSATHRGKGYYSVPLNATDTGTLGVLTICIHESGALPVWLTCHIVLQNVYDSLVGSGDYLKTDAIQISSSSTAGTNLKADYDGTGYAKANSTIGTVTTLTNPNPSAATIADAVWDEDIVAAHNTADTAGALLDDLGTPANFKADVTNLDAAITTRATPTQVATECDNALADLDLDHLIQVTAGAEEPTAGSYLDHIMHKDAGQTFDRTTDSLEALRENQSGATPAAIADAVWDEDIVAAHNTADTAGALLDDLGTPADFKANVTNLDAAITTRATPAQVATECDGALSDIDLDHLIQVSAGAEEPTDGSYLDQIMHKDAGQTFDPTTDSLEALRENQSGATPAAIADAVWDEDIVAAHNAADSAGALLDDLGTPANFKADVTNLDAAVSSRSAHSAADAADAVWDEDIVAAHNTGDTAGALLDDLATPANFKANVTNLDAAVSTRATPAQVATECDGALSDIDLDHLIQVSAGAEEPTAGSYLDHIMHKDAGQTFDPTTDSLEALRENQSGATPAAIADAVWDEDIVAAHNAADSAGALLDDLATPANFKADVTNLDAAVSTRATPAQVNTEADNALADYDPPTKAEMDSGFAGLNDPTAGAIADAVWDEDIVATHNTADTAGALLDDLGTPADFKADVSALALSSEIAALNDPTAATIADAVWDEATADHQSTGSTGKALTTAGAGSGAVTFTYTLTSTEGGNPPIPDADIWVTSDIGGDVTVASGRTNAQGEVVFYLDAGTYYVWRQKSGWDFSNPDTEVVS